MMKKRMLVIGICLAVCALVAGAIALVMTIDPPAPPEEENLDFGLTVNNEGIKVYRFSPKNVDYMQIENAHGSYRVRMDGGQVYIVDFQTVPLLAASSSGLFRSVETLSLNTVVDPDCENPARFGLDDPQATVTIQAYSDARVTFHIGDASPTGEYYYFSVEGDKAVYLVDDLLAERYLKSVAEYCDTKIYKTFDPAQDFRGLTIQSPTLNYSFRKANEEEKAINAVYFSGIAMESPYHWGVEGAVMEEVLTTMVALSADEVVAMCVPESDLATYGLDASNRTEIALTVYADPNPTMYNNSTNPYYDSTKPTGEYKEFTVTYWLGKTADKQVYVMFDQIPVVYAMPKDTFSWLEWTPYRYCTKILYGEYLNNLKSLKVAFGDEENLFTFTGNLTDESLRVNCNGVAVNTENFRDYYVNILSIYPSGEGVMPENAEALLSITYTSKEEKEQTVSFYSVDARNCIAKVGDEAFLTVRIDEINKVISDTHKLLQGKPIL
ncbi:MAG: DUF4340 domain-containing protein [Clostridia bacterium]|nr:DUF4340 domain-containing protein [Clostridia bacterium]